MRARATAPALFVSGEVVRLILTGFVVSRTVHAVSLAWPFGWWQDFTLHTGHFLTGVATPRTDNFVFTGPRRTLSGLKTTFLQGRYSGGRG